jgi:DMSO/TMAO reductase YedYZ heme-binding membrane subunit
MNIFMIIYSYYYYKIYKVYFKFITQKEADTYANLAYTCFLLYTIGFLEVFINKFNGGYISSDNIRLLAIIEGAILFAINYLIFNYKDRYLKIEEYFDSKGSRTTSIIGYLAFLILFIFLVWFGAKVFMMGRPGADWQIPE